MFKKIFPLLLLSTFFLFWLHPANAVQPDIQSISDIYKPWTITFNEDVNERADFQSIYIKSADNANHEASIHLSADSTQVIVEPTKPYQFGTKYTLVIPKGFMSASGKTLQGEVTKSFQVESDYIESIQTNTKPLVTDVIVEKKGLEIAKVTVSLDGFSNEMNLHKGLDNKYSRGIRGFASGDTLVVRAYDVNNKLLDTQYYDIQ